MKRFVYILVLTAEIILISGCTVIVPGKPLDALRLPTPTNMEAMTR